MVDRYEYDHFTDNVKQFALKELNENPSTVDDQIECLCRWVNSMPHLQCPTDAQFLLKFLRVSKFDQEKARKRLDNFCTVRTSSKWCPMYFQFYKLNDPIVEAYLNLQFQIPLGGSDSGQFVFLFRLKQWDPKLFPVTVILRLIYMGIDAVTSKEESQIFGISWLFDLEDISLSAIRQLTNPTMFNQYYKALQDSYPFRMNDQIFYSDSVFFDVIYQIMYIFMSSELKEKTFRIPKDIKRATEIIPGLGKILPTEYNGQGGTLSQCCARFSETFKTYFENGDPLQSIHVDENKRPTESLSDKGKG